MTNESMVADSEPNQKYEHEIESEVMMSDVASIDLRGRQ